MKADSQTPREAAPPPSALVISLAEYRSCNPLPASRQRIPQKHLKRRERAALRRSLWRPRSKVECHGDSRDGDITQGGSTASAPRFYESRIILAAVLLTCILAVALGL